MQKHMRNIERNLILSKGLSEALLITQFFAFLIIFLDRNLKDAQSDPFLMHSWWMAWHSNAGTD